MCLRTVDFSLLWDKRQKDFVGYGYKRIEHDLLNKYKRWHTATGNINVTQRTIKEPAKNILADKTKFADDRALYHPGFHIFLEKCDAEKYDVYIDYPVVKVMFKGVIAFGTNATKYHFGPCVIATHMKVVEVLDNVNS